MVYKRYVKKKVSGKIKTFGPYYYESYRDENGKTCSRYLPNYNPKRAVTKKFNFIFLVLFLAIVFAGLILINYEKLNFYSTGFVTDNDSIDEDEKFIEDFVDEGVDLEFTENEVISENLGEQELNVSEENISEQIEETNITFFSEENESNLTKTINESINESTILNFTKSNLTNGNMTINETLDFKNASSEIFNATKEVLIETKRARIIIGRPVKWIKILNVSIKTNTSVEIPLLSENITIKTGDEVDLAIKEIEDYNETLEKVDRNELVDFTITGMVSSDLGEHRGYLSKFFSWLKKITLTGKVISEDLVKENIIEKNNKKIVDIENLVGATQEVEVAIEYYTPAPQVYEEIIETKKIIIIFAPDELNYENILAYTQLENQVSFGKVGLYHLVNTSRIKVEIQEYDLDSNNLVDYIEWNVPHLSNQTYELIIEIIKADHLDSNRTFISDIYNEVKELDGVWSETIHEGEYVRVVFEKNLTKERDITIYPKTINGSVTIEIYVPQRDDSGEPTDEYVKVAEFTNLREEEYNKVYLDGLVGIEDTFDLLVLGGNVSFDHIIDPFVCGAGTCVFDDTFVLADLQICEDGIFGDCGLTTDKGIQMMWNISDLCDLSFESIDSALLQLYISSKLGTPDNDANIRFVDDLSWNEDTLYSTLNSQSTRNITTTDTFSSITASTYTNISILTQVREACLQGNDNVSIRIYDEDYPVSSIAAKTDLDPMFFGYDSKVDTGFNFVSREGTNKPKLFIDYSASGAAPTWSLNETNSTKAGSSILHSVYWTDDAALAGYIFSFDNGTGTFTNNTWVTMSGTTNWSNVSKVVNSTIGSNIKWKIYTNNSANGWGLTDEFSYLSTISEVPTHADPIFSPSSVYITSDLTCLNQSTSDLEGDEVNNIYNWRINSTSIMLLNMPFETNVSSVGNNLVRDYSGFSNSGTLGGGNASRSPTWLNSGKVGGAYEFNGTTNLEIDKSSSLNNTYNFTIELWMNSTDVSNLGYLFTNYGGGGIANGDFLFYIYQGKISYNNEGNTSTTSAFLQNNTWYHLVVTITNADKMELFVNGLFNESISLNGTGPYLDNENNFSVGSFSNGDGNYFKGFIDGLKVWNRTLSEEQIFRNYVEGGQTPSNSMIVGEETSFGDNLTCEVTPSDSYFDGITKNVSVVVQDCIDVGTSTTLSADSTACYIFDSDNSVLDCSNYKIQVGTFVKAINSTNRDNITIKNCFIQNSQFGIYFKNTTNSLIQNTTIFNSTDLSSGDVFSTAIDLQAGSNGNLIDGVNISIVLANSSSSTNCYTGYSYGIYLSSSINNNITDTNVYDVQGESQGLMTETCVPTSRVTFGKSIYLKDADSSLVYNSTIDKGTRGIEIYSTPNINITKNTINNFSKSGITVVTSSTDAVLNYNSLSSNDIHFSLSSSSTYPDLIGNKVYYGGRAIYLYVVGGIISDNEFRHLSFSTDNDGVVEIAGPGFETMKNNTFYNITSSGSSSGAIYVGSQISAEENNITNATTGYVFFGSSDNSVISNGTIANIERNSTLVLSGATNIKFYNITYDEIVSVEGAATFFNYYYLRVNVTDQDNNAMNSSTVDIINNTGDGSTEQTTTTVANGLTPWLTFLTFEQDSSGVTNHTPHIINASKTGYRNDSVQVIFDSSKTVYLETQFEVAPTSPTSLSLNDVNVTDTLTPNCSGSTDDNSDTITYYYRFYNIDDFTQIQAWGTDNTYVVQTSDAHDTINVTCGAYDGQEFSSGNYSNTKLVDNSIPSQPNPISLSAKKVGENLTTTCSNSLDADSDSLTYYYEFYNNDDATIVQSFSTDNSYVLQVSDAHDSIRIRCGAYDGYEYSINQSNSVTTQNSLPTLPTQDFPTQSSSISENYTLLNCSGSTDADNDFINYHYSGDNDTGSSYLGLNDFSNAYNWTSLVEDTYFWNCLASDGYANSSSTSNWNFTYASFSVAIDLSTKLSQQINWSLSFLPSYNQSAPENNGSGISEYYVNISVSAGSADLYVKANDDLLTPGLDVLAIGNETYSYNYTNSSVPSLNKFSLATTYVPNKIGNALTGNTVVYLKFFLNAPSGQPAGTYNNSLLFKVVENGFSPD